MNIGNNVRDPVQLAEEGHGAGAAAAGGAGDAPAGANNQGEEEEEEDVWHEVQEVQDPRDWNGVGPCPTCGYA